MKIKKIGFTLLILTSGLIGMFAIFPDKKGEYYAQQCAGNECSNFKSFDNKCSRFKSCDPTFKLNGRSYYLKYEYVDPFINVVDLVYPSACFSWKNNQIKEIACEY